MINRKQVLAIVCIHESFKENDQYQELYAAPSYMHITQEGPEDSFFGIVPVAEEEDTSLIEGSSICQVKCKVCYVLHQWMRISLL